MQRTKIDMMLFKIPLLISYISAVHTLQAGDVIVTGTPGGVGSRRTPPVYMFPGIGGINEALHLVVQRDVGCGQDGEVGIANKSILSACL